MSEQEQQQQQEERPRIRLTYMGPALKTPGSHVWRSEDGSLGVWKKLKARIPGGIYTVESKDNGSVVYPGTLAWTGEYAEDAAAIQLDARENERSLAVKRLEANASRTSKIDDSLGELLEIAAGLRDLNHRDALAKYVRDRIMRA